MTFSCTFSCYGYVDSESLCTINLESFVSRILTGDIGRPEFVVEIKDDDGGSLGTMIVGPLYPADPDSLTERWCMTFAEPNTDLRWCLGAGETNKAYRWYVFCGGETAVLNRCAVSLADVLRAIRKCCQEGQRSQSEDWVDMIEAMNLQ